MKFNLRIHQLHIYEYLPVVQLMYLVTNIFMYENRWLESVVVITLFWLSTLYPMKALQNRQIHIASLFIINILLYFQFEWLAALLIFATNAAHPPQKLNLWMALLAILAIQYQPLFFTITFLLVGLAIFDSPQYITYQYQFEYQPKVIKMIGHMLFTTLITVFTIGVYLGSLPFLEPQKLIIAIMPILATLFFVKNLRPVNEHFKVGYIFWLWILSIMASIFNYQLLPALDYLYPMFAWSNFLYLLFQISIQLSLICFLFLIFKYEYDTFVKLCPKRVFLFYHQIICAFVLIFSLLGCAICLTSVQLTHIQYVLIGLSTLAAFVIAYHHLFYILKVLLHHIMVLFFGLSVKGFKQFNRLKKPLIVVANHISYLDGPTIGATLPFKFIFPVNPTVAKMPIVQFSQQFVNIFPVKPNQPQLLRPFIEMLKTMSNGMIFPEGQRSSTANLLKIYRGTALCAQYTDANILPIFLDGPQFHITSRNELMLPKKWFPKITMNIGEPFKINHLKLGSFEIYQHLLKAQLTLSRPKDFYSYIQYARKRYSKNKPILYYKEETYTYREILKKLKSIQLDQKEFLGVNTSRPPHPLQIWKALTEDVTIVIGPIDQYQPNQSSALAYFNDDQWVYYRKESILELIQFWHAVSEITPNDMVFYQQLSPTPLGFCLGVIAPLLLGYSHVIGSEQGTLISEEIYEQRANILLSDQAILKKLTAFTDPYNLLTLRATFVLNGAHQRQLWQEKFHTHYYAIEEDPSYLLNQIQTPRFPNGIKIIGKLWDIELT
tara:strand:- start:99 stop:2429 length:2331 start_codon:yes stop_codon:yes gene_type:complete